MPSGPVSRLRAADWLALAATPTFALMALMTAIAGDSHAAIFCTQAGPPSVLTGMAPMYLLMAAFQHPPGYKVAKLLS